MTISKYDDLLKETIQKSYKDLCIDESEYLVIKTKSTDITKIKSWMDMQHIEYSYLATMYSSQSEFGNSYWHVPNKDDHFIIKLKWEVSS